MKIFILIGASGCGKGTLGEYICSARKDYVHIDAGKIVRQEIKNHTEFGKKIEPIYNNCKYLDESIDKIIWHEAIKNLLENCLNKNKNVILDGCFRSNTTYRLLDNFIKNNSLEKQTTLLQLKASDKTCYERILGRKICTKCSTIHNKILESALNLDKFKKCSTTPNKILEPAMVMGKCNKCGSDLEIRKSDSKEFTIERLLHYHSVIEPILEKAKLNYEYIEISTECEIDILKTKYDNLFV